MVIGPVLVIGRGRAGGAVATALSGAGVQVEHRAGRASGGELSAGDHEVVLLAVPDAAVAEAAGRLAPTGAVVAHLAGSLGLDVLAPHGRRASLHPLVALPSPEVGARRLRGATCAVAGSDDDALAVVSRLAAALGAHTIVVDDAARPAYHAAACVASNHVVALLAQAERLASLAGVPLSAYLDLVRATVDNVADLGPVAALTGPASRGDRGTVEAHLAAMPEAEHPLYRTLAGECARLAGREVTW